MYETKKQKSTRKPMCGLHGITILMTLSLSETTTDQTFDKLTLKKPYPCEDFFSINSNGTYVNNL